MDIKRLILYALTATLGVGLWNAWNKDYPPLDPAMSAQSSTTISSTTPSNSAANGYVPQTFQSNQARTSNTNITTPAATNKILSSAISTQLLEVKTDVLDILIDRKGGNIVSTKLLKYPLTLHSSEPVQILSPNTDTLYTVQNGLTNLPEFANLIFKSDQAQYTLSADQQALTVILKATTHQGLQITKTYQFIKGHYAISTQLSINNQSKATWAGSVFSQITRRQIDVEHKGYYTRSYNGAAISSPQTPYEKIPYKKLDEGDINRNIQGGWIAMQQHYFLTTWIPANPKLFNHYYSHAIPSEGGNIYSVGFTSPEIKIAPGEENTHSAMLYVGPEVAKNLQTLAPGLDHTIDYGWLWPISVIIFWVMDNIHSLIHNWGWSIVITTILIKILFYWFSAKSFRSMARMRELQPKIQALKERHGDDRQALSKATMELYRKEKINPLGGCLPVLIQIPVFIALYYVLIESVELRQAPFMLWIQDLSAKDPYYVLPILMGISMLAQQWLSPTTMDPAQQKMMWILPIVFTIFFLNFPSGLVLYWLVNNIVQMLQQWYVTKTFEKHKTKLLAKKKAKKYKRA